MAQQTCCPGDRESKFLLAMECYVALSAEQIVLNPDCGFATSAASPKDLDVAYRKLCVMCEAAESLRSDYD